MSRSPLSARSFFHDPVGYAAAHAEALEALELRAAGQRFVVVRDPAAVWRVLVTDGDAFRPGKWKRRVRRFVGDSLNTLDGPDHRRRRTLLQPVLDRRRIARFAPTIVARARRADAEWREGERIRLRDTLDRLSLTVAGDVLLSADLAPRAQALVGGLRSIMAAAPRLAPALPGTRAGRALARVERVADELLADRRARQADDDLVSALLDGGVPPRTVRGEIVAFLLAAVDEPPSALEAAWFLLARSPATEARLHAELDSFPADQPPPLDDRDALPFLRAIVRETLRLFPPARHIDRCPVREVDVGGVRAVARSNVIVSPVVTHREACLFDRAAEFVPERWLEPESPARNGARATYLPFGAGAHACIGEPLAWAIMIAALATIGRRWRLRVDADAPPPGPRAPGLVVTLERR